MSRTSSFGSRLLLGVLVCAATAIDAATTLSGVQTLSPVGETANSPRVAAGPDGNAIFAWVSHTVVEDCSATRFGSTAVQTRARSATGALSPIQAGDNLSHSPDVGMAASGNAMFTWATPGASGYPDLIKGVARAASGAMGTVQTLGSGAYPRVAVDANGHSVFSWGVYGGIQARSRSASGALTAMQIVVTTYGAQSITGEHDMAVDAHRNAVFVWAGDDETGTSRISTRTRLANGTLSAVQRLSAAGGDATDPRLAVDPDGNAVFVWQRWDGVYWRVQARARSAGGALSAVHTLSAPDQDAGAPAVAVDASGRALFAWSRFDGAHWRVQSRPRSATGVLGATETLSPAGQDAGTPSLVPSHADGAPQVAVDARGRAAFVWSRFDGANWRIQARARSSTGVLRAVDTLSGAGQDARAPRVVVDAIGGTVFAWSRCDGATWRVQTRTRTVD